MQAALPDAWRGGMRFLLGLCSAITAPSVERVQRQEREAVRQQVFALFGAPSGLLMRIISSWSATA